MPIAVIIPDSLVKSLADGLTAKIPTLNVRIEEAKRTVIDLTKKRDDMEYLLAQLKGEIKVANKIEKPVIGKYSSDLKWPQKIKYFLSLSKEPKASADIINYIISQEPEYGLDPEKKKTLAQIVSRETAKYKKGIDYYLAGTTASNKSLYGLKEWENKK
jgi:hypothetical protein